MRDITRRTLVATGVAAALAGGIGVLEYKFRPVTDRIKNIYVNDLNDAIIEVAGKSDLQNEQRSFLEEIADQLGIQYIKIDPEKEEISTESFQRRFKENERGVYFISEGRIQEKSGLSQHGIEGAALEYTIDKLEGTNAVLILGATWCGPCKSANRYIRRIIKDFDGYKVIYFNSRLDENGLEPLDRLVREEFGIKMYNPPTFIFYGRNVIVGGWLNTEEGVQSRVTREVGYLNIISGLQHLQPGASITTKIDETLLVAVPVTEILRQNKI